MSTDPTRPAPLGLRALLEKASALPWTLDTKNRPHADDWTFSVKDADEQIVASDAEDDYEGYSDALDMDDARFIVAAVNSLPDLLASHEAGVELARAAVEWWDETQPIDYCGAIVYPNKANEPNFVKQARAFLAREAGGGE